MLDLQHHIMVDNALGGVACDAAGDYAQILCRHVQQVGIITHVARFTVAALQCPHEAVEEFADSWAASFGLLFFGVAVKVVVEAEEKGFEL